ncbi:IS3 family transposase [Massilia sp. CCM 8694]|uniref:IS3 family transposase n=1 Tax=Massilia genomosp. 1 TaxID=2609280 RepID=A0ABX0MU57_9BURK|nr:IS3 family transposase [Massilia genomosp. 1]
MSRATVYRPRVAVSVDEKYTQHPFYVSRRMVVILLRLGWLVNRKRVQRLMRVMGLAGMAPGPSTTVRHPGHKVYPYLLRDQKAGSKQRMIGEFTYAAGTWDRQRRVIARLEHDARGANPRFIVTNLTGGPKALYERVYCARGEAENRIKKAQLDLFGRRASCHKFQANQLRLLLAAFAYTLMINLRRLALVGTELARACTATIRIKLLKIGAAVVRNTRRVRVLLASQHPLKHVFPTAARALAP